MATPVIIEAAINGNRGRDEHPEVPNTPETVSEAAYHCARAGASVVHFHAQTSDGRWSADPAWYAEAIRRIRERSPDLLISITSLRPAEASVSDVVALLESLARHPATRPDLISINLGHIVAWRLDTSYPNRRTTVHVPNSYDDIALLLRTFLEFDITPGLGIMDLGFVSNAVLLRDDGLLPSAPWFLLELGDPEPGTSMQIAASSPENYDVLADRLRWYVPGARWAGHGEGRATYAVIQRALADGQHVRVGFEDTLVSPDGTPSVSNATQVTWAVSEAATYGRIPAPPEEARAIIRGAAKWP